MSEYFRTPCVVFAETTLASLGAHGQTLSFKASGCHGAAAGHTKAGSRARGGATGICLMGSQLPGCQLTDSGPLGHPGQYLVGTRGESQNSVCSNV
jgi:hypothetical protein